MRLDPPSPFVDSNGTASKSPPLFRAQTATVVFSAEKDGKLRVRSSSLGDEAKVMFPGEVMEVSWGAQGVEARIVPSLRRGTDLAAAIDRASDPYDGDPDRVAKLQHMVVTGAAEIINPLLLYEDTEPNGPHEGDPTRRLASETPSVVTSPYRGDDDLGFPAHTL